MPDNQQILARYFTRKEFATNQPMFKLLRDHGIKVEVRNHLFDGDQHRSGSSGSIMVLVDKPDYDKALHILEENGYLSPDRLRKNSDAYLLERFYQLSDKIPGLNRLMPLQKLQWALGILVLTVAGIAIFAFVKGRGAEHYNRLIYHRWEVLSMDLDGERLNAREGIKTSDIVIGGYDFSVNYLSFEQNGRFRLSSFQGVPVRGNFDFKGNSVQFKYTNEEAQFPEGEYAITFEDDRLVLSSDRLRIVCEK